MSRRNKLAKFSELASLPNVYENADPKNPRLEGLNHQSVDLKGRWAATHFKNEQPIVLELACGRGEYTLALAERYPHKNFIGVDIKGARIWQGAKKALEQELSNAAFLRTRIEQITTFFAPEEVSEIWITFPDPFLRESKINRRLTAANFIAHYRKILAKDGIVQLKTDDDTLYDFTLETIEETEGCQLLYQDDNIYNKALPVEELEIKTYYEKMHLAKLKKIKYIQFKIN